MNVGRDISHMFNILEALEALHVQYIEYARKLSFVPIYQRGFIKN